MHILFITLGNELVASSRTRVFQYLPHLERCQLKYRIIRFNTSFPYWWAAKAAVARPVVRYLTPLVSLLVLLLNPVIAGYACARLLLAAGACDVVFIQKVALPAPVLSLLRRLGKPLVFDFDDAIYADDSYGEKRVKRMIADADLAVIENAETEDYVIRSGSKPLRITGPIDCDRYHPVSKPDRGELLLCWIGSTSTTEYLRQIKAPLAALQAEYPHMRLRLIGASQIDLPGVNVERHPWRLDSEAMLLNECDIGLMPLPDTRWARGKGGYKLLQYMAAGIPSVCSPVGVNSEIVVDGRTGFHAVSDDDWFRALSSLIANKELRESMGRRARERVMAEYSFEAATPKLVRALERVAHGYGRRNE
jgi:glycosyltransferase involved in cell wall biosynthesis